MTHDPFAGVRASSYRVKRVRLSAIGEAWGLFKAQWGTWILAGLLVLLGNAALDAMVSAIAGRGPHRGRGFRLEVPPGDTLLDAILSAVLNGFFLGGLFLMACRQVRGYRVRVSDLFGITDVFTELSIGLAIYGLTCVLLLPFGVIPSFILAGVWMFTIPLIVDARLTALRAIGGSCGALKGEWIAAALFHFIVYVIAGTGACCFCFGLLFTWPLYCLSIAVLYRDTFLLKSPADFAKKATPPPEL
jgi:hypothetical protein